MSECTIYVWISSCPYDSLSNLGTALEYFDTFFAFSFKDSLIILEINIAFWFHSSDSPKGIWLVFLDLIIKVVSIILIIELWAIYLALNVWTPAILLRASIRFSSCWLRLGPLPCWWKMSIRRVVMHHLHPVLYIYLFLKKKASRGTALHIPCVLFHKSVYYWWLVHSRSWCEASILLRHTWRYYLSKIRRSLVQWHRYESLVWLHSECTAIHLLELDLLLLLHHASINLLLHQLHHPSDTIFVLSCVWSRVGIVFTPYSSDLLLQSLFLLRWHPRSPIDALLLEIIAQSIEGIRAVTRHYHIPCTLEAHWHMILDESLLELGLSLLHACHATGISSWNIHGMWMLSALMSTSSSVTDIVIIGMVTLVQVLLLLLLLGLLIHT